MELSIIIVNWNTRKILVDCLESIFNNPPQNQYEIIVVDNNSSDDSVEVITKKFPQVTLIKNKENLGYAKANNQGIKKSQGKYILLLNSDTLATRDAFGNLIEFAKNHPQAGIIGGKLLNKDGSSQPSVGQFYSLPVIFLMLFFEHWFSRLTRRSPDKACSVNWVMGACLMITRQALDKAGLLDEKFFMYIEETEWCYRVKKSGFEIWFTPEAQIYHLFGASSPTGRKFAIINIYKGLIYLYQKHYSKLELFMVKSMLVIKSVLALIIAYLTGNKTLKDTYVEAFKLVG